jgi:uncharacterized membrane protein
MFKTVSNLFKEATVLVIIFGLSRQLIYYNSFHVPIKYFFSFSEVWLALINDIFFLLPYSLLMLTGYELAIKGRQKSLVAATSEESLKTQLKDHPSKKIKRRKLATIEVIFLILFVMLIIVSIYYWTTTTNFSAQVLFCLTTILAGFAVISIVSFRDKEPSASTFIAFCLFMIFFMLAFIINSDVSSVKRGLYKGTTITTKDSTYTSTDSSFFIGKTENYVFIHNLKDTSTLIIPSESILKIELKMK